MPIAIIVGAAVTLLGVVSVVFVMRHKRVEKNSMYSARRSQIEHKVRAARQRTLAPHGHAVKPPEAPAQPAGGSVFAPKPAAPMITYEPSAYEPPPAAPAPSPWDVGPATPQPSAFGTQAAPPAPPYTPPPPPPPPQAPPAESPVWTPAPAEPLPPAEPARPATPAGAGASWSIVGETKATAAVGEGAPKKKKDKHKEKVQTGAWELASGEQPGTEYEDMEVRGPSSAVAIAQYAVLVVGLVMVLIGVLVMVANSHVT